MTPPRETDFPVFLIQFVKIPEDMFFSLVFILPLETESSPLLCLICQHVYEIHYILYMSTWMKLFPPTWLVDKCDMFYIDVSKVSRGN